MAGELIHIDPSRIEVHFLDPNISYKQDQHLHCGRCGKWLFSMNRRVAYTHHGGMPLRDTYPEVPLNIFRMVRFCGKCKTYHVVYLDSVAKDL